MRTFLRLKNRQSRKLPAEFQHEDLRYSEDFVETFVRRFTHPGDVVLDPFAGYGTTLIVAEAMGRAAYGIEIDPRRVRYLRSQLQHPERLFQGSARDIATFDLPAIDFSIAAPPFMARDDAENPLIDPKSSGQSYEDYLHDLEQTYCQIARVLKPGARAVLEVANLKEPSGITMLAWDVGRAISRVLMFEGEIVIGWDTYHYGYDHSYCLVFRKPE
jgi:DNA modification methylase